MTEDFIEIREMALDRLAGHGIEGVNVYLIDIIPLIEMMWADGKIQSEEITILDYYLKKHVKHINDIAGMEAMTLSKARKFVSRFLRNRPDPSLLKTMRSFIGPLRLAALDDHERNEFRKSLLSACFDIASSAGLEYPYGIGEKFHPEEKRCFFEILESLSHDRA